MYEINEHLRNTESPTIILKHVAKMVDIKSAIDVGCGLGVFSQALNRMDVQDVTSLDGDWYDPKILGKYIDLNNFVCHDLDKGVYKSDRRYDLAICLEVAEHVKKENENNVVATLVGLSDVILFSAAIPHQGGDGHINEQWPSHWRGLFNKYGYEYLDVVRPAIWNEPAIYMWYRQNTFLVVRKELVRKIMDRFYALGIENQMLDAVHPSYWNMLKHHELKW